MRGSSIAPSNKFQVASNKMASESSISGSSRRLRARRLLASGLWLLLATAVAAAPAPTVDLGQNLSYLRLRRLPADAPALTAAWLAPALVVDLRYPAVEGAPAIPAGLPARPRHAPLFVLVGPATPADAVAALRAAAPALITLGLPAPGVTPDLVLAVDPAADRRAYDALDAGTALDALINVKIAKERFDEAALAREHEQDQAGTPPPDRPAATPAAAPAAPATPAAAPAPPPPPVDVVLQRAVQLHRALLALGRLPGD